MKQSTQVSVLLLLSCLAGAGFAQETAPAEEKSPTFDEVAVGIDQRLSDSLAELAKFREELIAEKRPLSQRLNELQSELSGVRQSFQQTTRLLDTRTLDLSNLKSEIKQREDQSTYLTGLFSEYTREFSSRLHRAESDRYAEVLEAAELAPENSGLSEAELDAIQLALVNASLDRIDEALGGTRFLGSALDEKGEVHRGTFALLGPVAYFSTPAGDVVGAAEQRINSLEPAAIPFKDPLNTEATIKLVRDGQGFFPLDATMGKAHKMEATEDTILDEVRKGGVVMYPIFGMAALALLLAVIKWLSMLLLRKPSKRKINALLQAVGDGDEELAVAKARAIRGPVGRMLTAGAEHLREPRELIEEVMYEVMLTTRLKLQGFLPFIAICAASAPLLGLLGTVTGIIKTFKMITVFGSGDVRTLSDGISEALITTKFGLVVAIPSLLLHAFLSRKARGVVGNMETSAVAFVNQVSRSQPEKPAQAFAPSSGAAHASAAPNPDQVRDQVNSILNELLAPIVQQGEHSDQASV
jgi:biopolymer transport protein ExbB